MALDECPHQTGHRRCCRFTVGLLLVYFSLLLKLNIKGQLFLTEERRVQPGSYPRGGTTPSFSTRYTIWSGFHDSGTRSEPSSPSCIPRHYSTTRPRLGTFKILPSLGTPPSVIAFACEPEYFFRTDCQCRLLTISFSPSWDTSSPVLLNLLAPGFISR
jgi:hypothetical protein